MQTFYIFMAAIFSNNYILSRLLGVYSVTDTPEKKSAIIWEGIFTTITIVILSILGHILYTWILEPLGISYMATLIMTLLLFIAAQFTVLISEKMGKYNSIEITAGQIMANSIVLAVILFGIDQDLTLANTIGNAFGAGIGYTLISVLLSDVMDKIDESYIVPAFRGLPLKLVSLGLMAYAFWGFCCLVK